ncbi:hypothetical protein ACSBR2_038339 [Camellia fascicularis]
MQTIKEEKIVLVEDDIPAAVAGRGAFLEEEKALKVVAVQEEPPVKLLDNDCGSGGGGGGGAFLEEEEEALKVVVVKEEPLVIVLDDDDCERGSGGGGGGGGGLPISPTLVPSPTERLFEVGGPPPFLKKIFEMVEDPNTNEIISWTKFRKSFIVFNPPQFSANLLPKYFKHSNFSSFIRQLNSYGFKKIGLDTWEFANEGFQGGKRHLLKTIKRRKRNPQNLQQEGTVKLCSDSPQLGVETEIEKLRNDWNKIKMEIQKLKKQQEITESCLVAVKEKMEKITKCKQQQIFAFVAKALDNRAMNKLINLRQKREIFNAQIAKKQRLASPQRSNEAMDNNEREQNEEELTIIESEVEKTLKRELCNGQIEKKQTLGSLQREKNSVEAMDNDREELATIKSEEKTLFHASMDDEGSPSLVQKASNVVNPGSVSLDLNSENYTFLQKLMEDEFEAQDEAELKQYHSKIVLEWENLIAKPLVEEEVEVDCVESSKH